MEELSRMNPIQTSAAGVEALRFEAKVSIDAIHRILFGRDFLHPENPAFASLFEPEAGQPSKTLFVLDEDFAAAWPEIETRIREYQAAHADRFSVAGLMTVRGGETVKNDLEAFEALLAAIERCGICRRSYVVAMGGGAVLDVAGFAASTAHRGVRSIRFPTTTLSQGDSGVGVKNGINRFGKKNFLGAFDIPIAVLNDELFLKSLSDRDWRAGFSEAVKVALVRDGAFFEEIESAADRIAERDFELSMPIVRRSAELHFRHIVEGGDPFERTLARPLDFGHWAAHKMEQMSDFSILHGEAVAMGVALDTLYSAAMGFLPTVDADRVCACLSRMGFALSHPVLKDRAALFEGIEEFRQHLGGELAVTLLEGIGRGFTCHSIDLTKMNEALDRLEGNAAQ